MRYSCGGNDHLKSLMETKEVLTSPDKDQESWFQNLDDILESGEPLINGSSTDDDHDYNEAVTSDAVQSYIAGYIVRKMHRNVKCVNCLQAIRMNAQDGKL